MAYGLKASSCDPSSVLNWAVINLYGKVRYAKVIVWFGFYHSKYWIGGVWVGAGKKTMTFVWTFFFKHLTVT